ncbi:TetR/AcrR family transcriptional regulator [Liquorilactobacillus satsumensis]|uniref:TetR/AcrR family transcriptional regulator n=1 Tax=Liquorilactobacillus satsumensis TaxID=259059 RepID=UPI0039E9D856
MSPQETKDQKLTAIFNALISLLKEKEFTAIKITELTQRAHVSRTYYYHNFSSLAEIIEKYELLSVTTYLRKLPHQSRFTMETLMEHYFQLAFQSRDAQLTLIAAGKEQEIIKSFMTAYLYLLKNDLIVKKNQSSLTTDTYWQSFIAGAIVNMSISWLHRGAPESPQYMGQKIVHFFKID